MFYNVNMDTIDFCVILKAKTTALCHEFDLQQGILYSEYCSNLLINIASTYPPNGCGDVTTR